jgi:hypothetical protein
MLPLPDRPSLLRQRTFPIDPIFPKLPPFDATDKEKGQLPIAISYMWISKPHITYWHGRSVGNRPMKRQRRYASSPYVLLCLPLRFRPAGEAAHACSVCGFLQSHEWYPIRVTYLNQIAHEAGRAN